ncbi:MAG TPA: hypothetical protein VNK41_07110 [Vicinamibacterales bacterium]|nr:hypothetical protein [Vicinamibacterales bacterium]
MWTIIKLLIAGLVLHALLRVGMAYWERYEFEDAVQRAVQFAERAPVEEIRRSVVELASEREIPLTGEDVFVERRQRQITVEAAYRREVEVLPRYFRTFEFDIRVSVLALN